MCVDNSMAFGGHDVVATMLVNGIRKMRLSKEDSGDRIIKK